MEKETGDKIVSILEELRDMQKAQITKTEKMRKWLSPMIFALFVISLFYFLYWIGTMLFR